MIGWNRHDNTDPKTLHYFREYKTRQHFVRVAKRYRIQMSVAVSARLQLWKQWSRHNILMKFVSWKECRKSDDVINGDRELPSIVQPCNRRPCVQLQHAVIQRCCGWISRIKPQYHLNKQYGSRNRCIMEKYDMIEQCCRRCRKLGVQHNREQ